MIKAIRSPKRQFVQEPHGVTSQMTAFFIVAAVKTSNLSYFVRLNIAVHEEGPTATVANTPLVCPVIRMLRPNVSPNIIF
jgi:hypothetical protein